MAMNIPAKARQALMITFLLAAFVIVLAKWLIPDGKAPPDIQAKKPHQNEEYENKKQGTQQGANRPRSERSGITTGLTGTPPANIEALNSPSNTPDLYEQSNSEQSKNGALSENTTQVHYLRARASAQSGVSSLSKRRFDIPAGWRLSALEVIQKKGRVRAFERNNYVIVEAHALASGDYSQAFANVKITIEKIPKAQSIE